MSLVRLGEQNYILFAVNKNKAKALNKTLNTRKAEKLIVT